MITKNHPSAYTELFLKAQEVLKTYGSSDEFKNANITNIDSYFSCLAELARIENEHPNEIDPIFTILPATEETFNIDADKRTISIPSNFAKYGVGVQGDEIAEILYFSIDRYFDAMDLAEMDIIVQWKFAGDNDNVSNLSATYKKSLTLQPGKIVFGWPITSEITERSGNVQFSIRFYRRDEQDGDKKLIYSFSTLTSTIKIQSGLNFDLTGNEPNLAINKSNRIYQNLRNSKRTDLGGYVIAAPEFEGYFTASKNEDGEDEFEIAVENLTYDLPVNFVVKAVIPANTSSDKYVSPSGLSYVWKKDDGSELNSSHIYKKVETNVVNPYEIYYEEKNGVYEPYYVTGDNNPFDDIAENGEPIVLYTRHSVLTPQEPGVYYAEAYNTYVPGASVSVKSNEWIVPEPQEPMFEYDDKVVLFENEDDNASVIVSINSVNSNDNGDLDYYWNKLETQNVEVSEKIEDSNNKLEIEVQDEGYYFITANNVKNNATNTVNSDMIEVKHQASIPVIISNSGSVVLGNEIFVTVAAPKYSSKVTYQWLDIDGNPILGAVNSNYISENVGMFKCSITNEYKGTSQTILSDWINVNPN